MEVSNFKRIILITGSPCIGKTTISGQLATKLNGVHIDLSKIALEEKLTCGVDEERETLIVDRVMLSRRVKQIIEKISQSQDVIIDGHYAMDVAPKKIYKAFVLRRHPRDLKRLMEKRGFKERKIIENVAAEILDVCLFDALKTLPSDKVCEVDLSSKRIDETIKEIISILDGQKPCNFGIVDWLEKLDKEKSLEEFLKALNLSNLTVK